VGLLVLYDYSCSNRKEGRNYVFLYETPKSSIWVVKDIDHLTRSICALWVCLFYMIIHAVIERKEEIMFSYMRLQNLQFGISSK
jgi:hypothetical protein